MHVKISALALSATLVLMPAQTILAQGDAKIAPKSAGSQAGAAQNWTQEELVTATVHQAWLLSGRNEATFFEMVTQLAELSAKNRNLQLPEDAATGRRVGEQIKLAAKSDTDQLLYAVVDSAVRRVGKPSATTAHP